MWGAARLDADTYEEVEADRGSLQQAAVVVVAAALAIGAARWAQAAALGLPPSQALLQVAVSVLEPLVLWVGGSAVALMVGATFFRGPETESDFAEVLRTTGFAFTPALLRGLGALPPPVLGLAIDFAARAWVLVAVVIALRQALDFTTVRAIGTFGTTAVLLYLILWGLTVAPLPL
jgi:hypothetical protein